MYRPCFYLGASIIPKQQFLRKGLRYFTFWLAYYKILSFMARTEIDPSQFEGLLWSNHPDLPAKLGRFALATPDETHYLVDFDRCMTTSDLDTWGVTQSLQTKQGKEKDELLDAEYHPDYLRGLLSDEEITRWWRLTLDNIVTNIRPGTDLNDFREAGRAMTAREGLVEHFELLEKLGIPTVILSAGISNPISGFLDKYKLKPKLVIANELSQNPNTGKVGYDTDNLIDINRKYERALGNGDIEELRRTRPYVFVIGDGTQDARMAGPDRWNVVSIRTSMPQNLTPQEQACFLRISAEKGFDAVSADGTFRPIHRATGALALHGTSEGTDLRFLGA